MMIITLKRFQFTERVKRKLRDFVHFPLEGLDLSKIIASDKNTNSPARKGDNDAHSTFHPEMACGRKESLYDLYAVIHHQGALAGGHYVASLKSETDGQWRLFNDSTIYEVDGNDVIDASAYILFYIRRDVKEANLEHFWDTQPREGHGMSEEEVEKLVKSKDRCTIS